MCDCKSYNLGVGERPATVLDPNPHFVWDNDVDPVSVDACIAAEIEALWEAGIWTRGCCCGHGDRNPNVVIAKTEDPETAIRVLEEVDPSRSWDVLQWQLVNTSKTTTQ